MADQHEPFVSEIFDPTAWRVVPGRTNGAKGVVHSAIEHRIGGCHGSPGRTPDRRSCARTRPGVRVERTTVAGGLKLLQEIIQRQDVVEVVGQCQVGIADQRHRTTHQTGVESL